MKARKGKGGGRRNIRGKTWSFDFYNVDFSLMLVFYTHQKGRTCGGEDSGNSRAGMGLPNPTLTEEGQTLAQPKDMTGLTWLDPKLSLPSPQYMKGWAIAAEHVNYFIYHMGVCFFIKISYKNLIYMEFFYHIQTFKMLCFFY